MKVTSSCPVFASQPGISYIFEIQCTILPAKQDVFVLIFHVYHCVARNHARVIYRLHLLPGIGVQVISSGFIITIGVPAIHDKPVGLLVINEVHIVTEIGGICIFAAKFFPGIRIVIVCPYFIFVCNPMLVSSPQDNPVNLWIVCQIMIVSWFRMNARIHVRPGVGVEIVCPGFVD